MVCNKNVLNKMVSRVLLIYTISTLITEPIAEASEIKISFGKKSSENHTIAFKTRDIAEKEYRKHIQYHPTAILEEPLTTPKSRKDTFNFEKDEDGKKKHHHKKYKKVKNGKKINTLLSDVEPYITPKRIKKGKNNNIVSDVDEKVTNKDTNSEDASEKESSIEPLEKTLGLPMNVEKLNAKVPKKGPSKKDKIKKDVKPPVKHKHILRVKHRDAKQTKKAKNTKPSKITSIDTIIESKESITGDNDSPEMDTTLPSNMEKLKAAVPKKKDKSKKDVKPKIVKQKNILRIKHREAKQTKISKYTKPLKVTVIDNIIDSKESVSRDIEQTVNRNTQSDEKTVEVTLPKQVNDNRKDFEKETSDYPVIHDDYDNIKPYGQSDSTNEENSDHSISEDNELYKLKIQNEELITTTLITTEKSKKIRVSRLEGPFEKIGRNKHYFYKLKPKNNKKHDTNALRMKLQHPKRLRHSSKHLHKKNRLHKHGKSDLKSKTVKIKKGKLSNGKVDFEKGITNIVRQGPNVDSEEKSSSIEESKIQEKVTLDSNEALLKQKDLKDKANDAATENVRDTSFTKKPRKIHKKHTTAKDPDVTTENSAIDSLKKILQEPLKSNEIDLNATLDRFASSKLFDIFTERLANQMLLKMQRRLGDSKVKNLARRTEIEPDTVERIEISITNDGDMVINQDLKKDGTNESMLYVNPNLRSTVQPLRFKMHNYRY